MKKFCPKCGAPIKSGTFCTSCTEPQIEFKAVKIKLCPSNRVFQRGKWTKFSDLRKLSEKLVKNNVKEDAVLIEGLETFENLLSKPGLKRDIMFKVQTKEYEFELPVHVEVTYSPYIGKIGGTYYEGILQLRNARADVKEYVKNYIEKNASRKVFVNKIVDVKDSVDYYFLAKKHMIPLGLKIIRNFGGVMDSNSQVFSRNSMTSKDIFRVNVLVIVPLFSEKDVVVIEEKPIKVTRLNKIISGINLMTGKKYTFKMTSDNINLIKPLKKFKAQLITLVPQLEVIDPETYQNVSIKNTLNRKPVLGQNLNCVRHNSVLYLVN